MRVVDSYRDNEETSGLVEEILDEYATPVSKFIERWDKDEIGRLMYLLKSIEIAGLVDVVRKQQRPTICLHYFDKAHFTGQHR